MKTINEIIANKIISNEKFYEGAIGYSHIDKAFKHYNTTNDSFVINEVNIEKDYACPKSNYYAEETVVSIAFIVDFGDYNTFYCYVEVDVYDFCTFISDNYVKNS